MPWFQQKRQTITRVVQSDVIVLFFLVYFSQFPAPDATTLPPPPRGLSSAAFASPEKSEIMWGWGLGAGAEGAHRVRATLALCVTLMLFAKDQ